MMPILDGFETLKKLVMEDKRIPEQKAKIIASALSNRETKEAFDLGCTAYAGKPIDQKKFEGILKKLELI